MRVACVLITHLRAKAEMRRLGRGGTSGEESEKMETGEEALPRGATLVVDGGGPGARAQVVDYFPGASGVRAGMTLEQAASQQEGTVALPADEPYYREFFAEILTSLQGISDRVEGGELGAA